MREEGEEKRGFVDIVEVESERKTLNCLKKNLFFLVLCLKITGAYH
jgi:hypothetical protein